VIPGTSCRKSQDYRENETQSFDVPPALGQGARAARGCPAEKVTAKDRRCAALRERYRTAEALTEAGCEQIAADIEKLLDLGKTDAWKGAIKDWAAALRDEDNRLNWAYCQYGVCAGHAA
jgi:hypothetical protein